MPAQLRIARSKLRPAQYADALVEAVRLLKLAKDMVSAAEEIRTERENEVLSILASAGVKTSTVPLEGMRYRVALVQSERMGFNEPSLRKALSAPVYDKLCDLKLNRNKLEEAIADGRVDPVVVAINTVVTKNKPFVKLTPIQGSEQ